MVKFLRCLLLRLADGVEREKLELTKEVLKGAEGECSELKLENRQLKTKVKELRLGSLKVKAHGRDKSV